MDLNHTSQYLRNYHYARVYWTDQAGHWKYSLTPYYSSILAAVLALSLCVCSWPSAFHHPLPHALLIVPIRSIKDDFWWPSKGHICQLTLAKWVAIIYDATLLAASPPSVPLERFSVHLLFGIIVFRSPNLFHRLVRSHALHRPRSLLSGDLRFSSYGRYFLFSCAVAKHTLWTANYAL